MSEFARRRNAAPMFPFCHVTYGGLLAATGRWSEAEQELQIAIRTFDAGHRGMKVLALGRLADLRIRQGRIEEAMHRWGGFRDQLAGLPLDTTAQSPGCGVVGGRRAELTVRGGGAAGAGLTGRR